MHVGTTTAREVPSPPLRGEGQGEGSYERGLIDSSRGERWASSPQSSPPEEARASRLRRGGGIKLLPGRQNRFPCFRFGSRPAIKASRRAASLSGVWLRRTFTISAVKGRDGGLQLHAIVGGGRLSTGQLAHVIAISKQCSPTVRSGVSITCAVGVDRYPFPTATFCHAQNLCFPLWSVEEFRRDASVHGFVSFSSKLWPPTQNRPARGWGAKKIADSC